MLNFGNLRFWERWYLWGTARLRDIDSGASTETLPVVVFFAICSMRNLFYMTCQYIGFPGDNWAVNSGTRLASVCWDQPQLCCWSSAGSFGSCSVWCCPLTLFWRTTWSGFATGEDYWCSARKSAQLLQYLPMVPSQVKPAWVRRDRDFGKSCAVPGQTLFLRWTCC